MIGQLFSTNSCVFFISKLLSCYDKCVYFTFVLTRTKQPTKPEFPESRIRNKQRRKQAIKDSQHTKKLTWFSSTKEPTSTAANANKGRGFI